jgi:hypothetical protein
MMKVSKLFIINMRRIYSQHNMSNCVLIKIGGKKKVKLKICDFNKIVWNTTSQYNILRSIKKKKKKKKRIGDIPQSDV